MLTTRRRLLASAAGMASLALPGISRRGLAGEDLKFGLTPVFLTNDLELLEQLKVYLEAATGRSVHLVQRRTYQEITSLLLGGQLDAAWICGYPYVRYRPRLQLLALPVWRGRPVYQSYLIVGADRDAGEFESLQGDIHAFSDPDSNSGYLVTTALLAGRGLHPSEFFSRTFFTYGHRNVVRAVSSGLAQSGSVDGYVWEVLNETEPGLTKGTRILRKSEWLGFPPLAGPALPRDQHATVDLASAFLRMHRHEVGKQVLHLLRLDKFEEHSPDIFDQIAKKVEQVKRLG